MESTRKDGHTEGNLRIIQSFEVLSEVMCVRFTPDGVFLAVGLAEGLIKVYNVESGSCIYTLSDQFSVTSRLPVTCICFLPTHIGTPDSKYILVASYASGAIKLWQYTTGKCLQTLKENRATLVVNMNPFASLFLTGGADIYIHQYDLETGTLLRQFEPSDSHDKVDGHRARVFAVQHHPSQIHIFLSGGWDDTVQVWDDRQGNAFRHIYGPHICGEGLDVDGHREQLLTASWRKENVLQIWDFPTGQKLKDIAQDATRGSLLYCGQWVGKDFIVCGGSDHNMARLIDRSSYTTLGQFVELSQGVYSIDNEHQGSKPKLAIASGKCVYILKMDRK